MTDKNLVSFLFRFWVTLLPRPMRLNQLRPLWREASRFVAMDSPRNR